MRAWWGYDRQVRKLKHRACFSFHRISNQVTAVLVRQNPLDVFLEPQGGELRGSHRAIGAKGDRSCREGGMQGCYRMIEGLAEVKDPRGIREGLENKGGNTGGG